MGVRPDDAIRWQRPDVEAPLIVWEYAFALERRVERLETLIAQAAAEANGPGGELIDGTLASMTEVSEEAQRRGR